MIVFFSGTGNTARVARALASHLEESEVLELAGDVLVEPSKCIVDTAGARVIWMFPTYSWGVPPVVARVIRECVLGPGARAAKHYMVTTCGDDMAYTDRQWRRLVETRGCDARSAFAVIMPNTYTLMKGFDVDTPEVSARKLAEAAGHVREIAAAIKNDGPSELVRGSFPWVKSAVIYSWFVRFAMSPKPFHATGGCISCGLCARICPMQNIRMDGETPVWSHNCALCLRCYHYCPRHAVAYGDKTIGKGQWQCPKK